MTSPVPLTELQVKLFWQDPDTLQWTFVSGSAQTLSPDHAYQAAIDYSYAVSNPGLYRVWTLSRDLLYAADSSRSRYVSRVIDVQAAEETDEAETDGDSIALSMIDGDIEGTPEYFVGDPIQFAIDIEDEDEINAAWWSVQKLDQQSGKYVTYYSFNLASVGGGTTAHLVITLAGNRAIDATGQYRVIAFYRDLPNNQSATAETTFAVNDYLQEFRVADGIEPDMGYFFTGEHADFSFQIAARDTDGLKFLWWFVQKRDECNGQYHTVLNNQLRRFSGEQEALLEESYHFSEPGTYRIGVFSKDQLDQWNPRNYYLAVLTPIETSIVVSGFEGQDSSTFTVGAPIDFEMTAKDIDGIIYVFRAVKKWNQARETYETYLPQSNLLQSDRPLAVTIDDQIVISEPGRYILSASSKDTRMNINPPAIHTIEVVQGDQ